MCEGVHSSLHKPTASSAEERRLILTDMLKSQQSLQENSSSSADFFCSPCPWCSLGIATDHNLLPRVLLIGWDENKNGARASLPRLRGEVVDFC